MSDDENDPDYDEGSYDTDDDDLPMTLGRVRADWVVTNVDAIGELYAVFLRVGRDLFGSAFHQNGRVDYLAKFVFKFMQPGAV